MYSPVHFRKSLKTHRQSCSNAYFVNFATDECVDCRNRMSFQAALHHAAPKQQEVAELKRYDQTLGTKPTNEFAASAVVGSVIAAHLGHLTKPAVEDASRSMHNAAIDHYNTFLQSRETYLKREIQKIEKQIQQHTKHQPRVSKFWDISKFWNKPLHDFTLKHLQLSKNKLEQEFEQNKDKIKEEGRKQRNARK